MYRAYGLLTPTSDFTLEEARRRLSTSFPGCTATLNGRQITLASPGWEMEFLLNDDPGVLSESEGLAGNIAGLEPGNELERCDRRVEIWSDTPDPMMAHFDDFLRVIEVMKTFQGLYPVEPKEPNLL